MSEVNKDVSETKEVPLLVKFQQQLESFYKQREFAKNQFEQLQGAIFACENMIKQYQDSVSLNPNENLGETNDGEVDKHPEEEAA